MALSPSPSLPPSVAVLGNGPVGQTTALLLARWGVPSVLIDRRLERDLVGSKAICQQRDVLDVWDACGGGRVFDEGPTWSRARTFSREHELVCVEVKDFGPPPFPPFRHLPPPRPDSAPAGAADPHTPRPGRGGPGAAPRPGVSGHRRVRAPTPGAGRRRRCATGRHPMSTNIDARVSVIYECPECETRYLDERRCPDCNLFTRRIGPGGPCPHCDEPVAQTDLT